MIRRRKFLRRAVGEPAPESGPPTRGGGDRKDAPANVWDGLVEQRRADRDAESERDDARRARTRELTGGFSDAAADTVREATGARDVQVLSCTVAETAGFMADPEVGAFKVRRLVADGGDGVPRSTDLSGGRAAEAVVSADGLPIRVEFFGYVDDGYHRDNGQPLASESARATPCVLTDGRFVPTGGPAVLWRREREVLPGSSGVSLSAALDARNGRLPPPDAEGAERLRAAAAETAEKYGLMSPYEMPSEQGFGPPLTMGVPADRVDLA